MKTFLIIAFTAAIFVGCGKAGTRDYHSMTVNEIKTMEQTDKAKSDSIKKTVPADEMEAVMKAMQKRGEGDSAAINKMTFGQLVEEGKKLP